MNHPFADLIGLVFESVHQGRSLCRIEVDDKLMNPHGVVHGSIMSALADTGMGGALYPLLAENESCATIEIKISYFKPVRKGTLECTTQLLQLYCCVYENHFGLLSVSLFDKRGEIHHHSFW